MGLAETIDPRIEALLNSGPSAADRETAARKLHQALIAPLSEHLARFTQIHLAPDGILDLVPFAELIAADGKHWIRQQAVRIVRTGRDLLPGSGGEEAQPKTLIARGGTERPLTLAGLALAGANQGRDGGQGPSGEDGILYALEAQDLNLRGTQLVTLSACETSRGALDSTDCVYGLVRSFQLAGAENVLMTLWQLDDALAADFMADFYRNWLSGKGLSDNDHHQPAEALRATQLAWIESNDPDKRNPYHWAPYVVVERR